MSSPLNLRTTYESFESAIWKIEPVTYLIQPSSVHIHVISPDGKTNKTGVWDSKKPKKFLYMLSTWYMPKYFHSSQENAVTSGVTFPTCFFVWHQVSVPHSEWKT